MGHGSSSDTELNGITGAILGAAVEVHRRLGPGLLESVYQACLAAELGKRGIRYRREVPLPVEYDGQRLDCGYRLDFLVEERVVVEAKSVRALEPIFTAQTLTYLRIGRFPVGLLINFNVPYMGEGAIRRLVNDYAGRLPRDSAFPR